jgi:hypothetical protein
VCKHGNANTRAVHDTNVISKLLAECGSETQRRAHVALRPVAAQLKRAIDAAERRFVVVDYYYVGHPTLLLVHVLFLLLHLRSTVIIMISLRTDEERRWDLGEKGTDVNAIVGVGVSRRRGRNAGCASRRDALEDRCGTRGER